MTQLSTPDRCHQFIPGDSAGGGACIGQPVKGLIWPKSTIEPITYFGKIPLRVLVGNSTMRAAYDDLGMVINRCVQGNSFMEYLGSLRITR